MDNQKLPNNGRSMSDNLGCAEGEKKEEPYRLWPNGPSRSFPCETPYESHFRSKVGPLLPPSFKFCSLTRLLKQGSAGELDPKR